MLTKNLAKEAAILMCKRADLKVLKVGRWRRDGQNFKRGFTCRHYKGYEFIAEIIYITEENHVYCKDFFNDALIDDFLPGREEWDDEIEFELKDKFDTNPALKVGLDKPTREQVKEIGLKMISENGFGISDISRWYGGDTYGFYSVYTNKGNLILQLYKDGTIRLEKHGKVIDFWVPTSFKTTYAPSLLVKAERFLSEMFDGTSYIFLNNTGWTPSKNCMIAYLVIYDNVRKYAGKAILTEDGEINVYADDKHILSHNCYRGLEI